MEVNENLAKNKLEKRRRKYFFFFNSETQKPVIPISSQFINFIPIKESSNTLVFLVFISQKIIHLFIHLIIYLFIHHGTHYGKSSRCLSNHTVFTSSKK